MFDSRLAGVQNRLRIPGTLLRGVVLGGKQRAQAVGCCGFIEKPIQATTFADEVASFLTPPAR